MTDRNPGPGWFAAVAAIAVITYWRFFDLPLISDDYTVIDISRSYGELGGWNQLANDALYRCRATFMILTYWLDRWFGLWPLPYNVAGIAVHALNSMVVLAFGAWPKIGWRLSLPAAILFAVLQAHQEAVIWYSALPDQIAFFFVATAVGAWLLWLRGRGAIWYGVAAGLFVVGLFSKESAIVAGPLMLVAAVADGAPRKRVALALIPFAAVSAVYFLAGYAARSGHLHYNDGTFTLGIHFIPVIFRSTLRLLWPWGLLALAAILLWRRQFVSTAGFSLAWIAVSFLPYAFLTYMPFVPSRHTYIASAGVALIGACGFRALQDRFPHRPAIALLLAAAVIGGEWGYLWTRKYQQYVERAAPSEIFIEKIRNHTGEVVIYCFPYGLDPVVRGARLVRGDAVTVRMGEPFRATGPCDFEADIVLIPARNPVLP